MWRGQPSVPENRPSRRATDEESPITETAAPRPLRPKEEQIEKRRFFQDRYQQDRDEEQIALAVKTKGLEED